MWRVYFLTLAQFRGIISPHWLSAEESRSKMFEYSPALAQCLGFISLHCVSAGELFHRTGSVRRNYFSARSQYGGIKVKMFEYTPPPLAQCKEIIPQHFFVQNEVNMILAITIS